MRIVSFKGGFANQLFQYCLYLKLIELYPNESVCADVGNYKNRIHQHEIFWIKEIAQLNYCNLKKVKKEIILVDENNYEDITNNPAKNDEVYLYDGYWQNDKYFPNDMGSIFSFFYSYNEDEECKKYVGLISQGESVSLHVRRGDYKEHYLHGNIATRGYFQNAIDLTRKMEKQLSYFVFSDDIEWCIKNLDFYSECVTFIEGNVNTTIRDMYLMSLCRQNIISNSTYSWWAQYINHNFDKKMYAPRYWFNDEIDFQLLGKQEYLGVDNVYHYTSYEENPFFSIIIPAYNSQDTIRRSISSVLNQTFLSFEVIVIDDASQDNTCNIVEEYANIDRRIKIITKDSNSSLAASRILGLENAVGQNIVFLDADDYLSENALEILFNSLKDEYQDILEYAYVVEPSKEIVICDRSMNNMTEEILTGVYPHTVWNKVYSRKLIEKIMPRLELFYCNMFEDFYFSTIFSYYAETKKRILAPLVHYVTVGGMSNTGIDDDEVLDKCLDSNEMMITHLKSFFLKIEDKEYLLLVDKLRNDNLLYLSKKMLKPCEGSLRYMQMLRQIDLKCSTSFCEKEEKLLQTFCEAKDIFWRKGIVNKLKGIVFYCFTRMKNRN